MSDMIGTKETVMQGALERYDEAEKRWGDNRTKSRFDIEFGRLGRQWPDDIRRKREQEERPMLVINRIPAFLRGVVNSVRMSQPAIKISPIDSGADPKVASVLQGLVKSIEKASDADVAYDTAIDSSASCGIGFIRVDVDYAHNDSFDMDILLKPVENMNSVLFDTDTKAYDSSDWNYAFQTEMMPERNFKTKYPNADELDFRGDDLGQSWFNEDGVRVAEYWLREETVVKLEELSNGMTIDEGAVSDEQKAVWAGQGIELLRQRDARGYKITHRTINGVEVLNETEWTGTIIPLVPVYGELVNYEGRRIWRSLFRDAIDSQKMINYWRTTATELVALSPRAPYIGPEDAFKGLEDEWSNANTENYAYLPYKGNIPPQRNMMSPIPAAAINEGMVASDNMKEIMGIYDASMGARSNETSGKAIRARQAMGDIATANFPDNLARSIKCVGRIIVELIPLVYTAERVVRVLGEDNKPDMVTINEKITGPDGTQQVLNDITVGKYDVSVESGQSLSTRRQEASEAMVELVRSFPDAAPVLGDLIAKNMDWPEADKVAERLHFMLPPEIRAAEEQKKAEEAGDRGSPEEQLEQAKRALAEKDQQMAQMGEQIQAGIEALEQEKQGLEEQRGEIDEKMGNLTDAAERAKLEQDKTRLLQKTAKTTIDLEVQKAELKLTKLITDRQELESVVDRDTLKAEESAGREDILVTALENISAAMTQLSAPKTVQMTGQDGRVRTAVVEPTNIG